ncbi:MAG: NAD(P)H-dependent oxidoreductase [Luteolibacter sp.]
MKTPRILAFSGSLRADSYNQKIAAIAAEGAVEAGAEVTVISLRDFPMPLFDQDIEDASGLPETAKKLKEIFLAHDGLLIASPEYNSSVTAALKNAIDWISRQSSEDEAPLSAFRGKTAVIFAASPGGYGGLRGLVHLRAILGNIGVNVLPDQIAVPKVHEALDSDGHLVDPRQNESIKKLGATLTRHLQKLLA